jgi:alkylation response protein AidB-like acyl-CoA dehydrogenase
MPAVLGRPKEALSYPLWWAVQRGAKLCTIGEGTSEIQRLVIARELIGG